MTTKLAKRSDKVAYFGVGSVEAETFARMKGFTEMSTNKNPSEYSRRYVDEAFEQTDVTGYSPSISYGFDHYIGDTVHDDIVGITDNEKLGDDAVRSIVIVDFTKPVEGKGYEAKKRSFAVIPDSEGDSTDAYTYSGTFRSKGEVVHGTATVENDVATFIATAAEEDNAATE